MTALRTCNGCGWVHFGISREHAEREVAHFNTYFEACNQETKDMFGNKPSSIEQYEHCNGCGGPYTYMREFTAGDCPDGCTIGPIIVELPDAPKVNS